MHVTRSLAGDIALAVALAVIGIVGTAGADLRTEADLPIDTLGYALVVATAATLVPRRRWPLVTLAAATVLTSTYLIVGYPYGPIMASFLVAVYTVARYVSLGRSIPASLAALGVLLVHLFTNDAALPGFLGVVPGSAFVVVPFAIGTTVRLTQQSVALARAEAVRRRVDDERLRVAQEVHDVVGHGLAAIKMQADIALHLLPKTPDQAEPALQAISRTSTEALDELRATLAVVRRTGTDASRAPAPGLDRLDDLCLRMREAGVQISLESTGAAHDLPAAVDLAGYRVVQESLTNVLRHSAVKVADVRIDYGAEAVIVTISNPAPRTADRADGLGIPGMRERVTALGGEFSAGPTHGGRFEVRAFLPTGGFG